MQNTWDTVANLSPVGVDACWYFDASWQKSTEAFFPLVPDHTRSEGSVFLANMSDHYGVVETTVGVQHEDIRRHLWSIEPYLKPVPSTNDRPAVGGSSVQSMIVRFKWRGRIFVVLPYFSLISKFP